MRSQDQMLEPTPKTRALSRDSAGHKERVRMRRRKARGSLHPAAGSSAGPRRNQGDSERELDTLLSDLDWIITQAVV